MISTSQFKSGVIIKYNNDMYEILEFQLVKMQQRQPIVRTRMRNIKTGSVLEQPFRSGEKGQLMTKKSTDVQSQVAVDLLAGGADLKKSFQAKRLGEGHYELKPLKSAGDISRIKLLLERSTKLVYKIVLTHSTGNETELVLKNVKLGVRLDDSRFEFKAPPGTDEIR